MAIDLSKYKKATTTQATGSPKVDLSKYKKQQGKTGLEGFSTGFTQSVLTPLQNIGKAVLKPLEITYEAVTGKEPVKFGIPEEILTPKSTAEKVGFTTGTVAQYIAPTGAVNRATQGLSAIPRIAARTAPDVAISLAQTGGDLKAGAGTAGASAVANALLPGGGTAITTGRQIASGYLGDVSMGLAGQRGEAREGASAFIPGLGTAIGTTIPVASKTLKVAQNIRQGNFKNKGDVNKLIGEITQVVDDNQKQQLTKAFSNLDVKNVKNYKDLSNTANQKIKLLSESLDDVLDTNKNLYKIDELTITKDIDGQPVQANFVNSALNHLENLYKSIDDPFNATKIQQLRNKAQTQGLSVKEINKLARDYGNEFSQKAFSKIGEPLTSVTAQGLENTRSGVKQTARDIFGNDVFNKVDDELSALIRLRQSSDKVNKSVERLRNRIKERTLGEKLGRLLFQATDILSLGTFGGFTRAILPRGQGFKVMNALDLEKTLQNNLQQLDNLLNIKDKNLLEAELRKIINQSQALPDNQLNTISAANTAKNVAIPPQSNIPPKKSSGLINTIKKKIDETPNKQGGFIKLPQGKGEQSVSKAKSSLPKNTKETFIGKAEDGYKPAPLTTKLLKKLEGKTTVSKQFILDLTNSPDLKQVEKDLIRAKLEGKGNTINVKDFGKEVEAELLPLKIAGSKKTKKQLRKEIKNKGYDIEEDLDGGGYIVDKNGNDIDYDELPRDVKSLFDEWSGGEETYKQAERGRYESIVLSDDVRGNVADYMENIYESPIKTSAGNVHFSGKTDNYFGHTRIEDMADNKTRRVIEVQSDLFQKGNLERELKDIYGVSKNENEPASEIIKRYGDGGEGYKKAQEARMKESSKLQQYNNPTAHFRMIREEIQKASKDGKTKLQFPTGETAMKIEGLGETQGFVRTNNQNEFITPSTMKVGDEISGPVRGVGDNDWIITDILGDGKFKAVPKNIVENNVQDIGFDLSKTGDVEDALSYMRNHSNDTLDMNVETFDISGKVDTNNPIYKFYDKEVQKYLKNNYDAKLVTDKQGVTWFEVPVKKEYKNMPIEAFGLVGALGLGGASLMSNE